MGKPLILTLVLCGTAFSLCSCSTIEVRFLGKSPERYSQYEGPIGVFPATRRHGYHLRTADSNVILFLPIAIAFVAVDLSVSFASDVLLLPYDICATIAHYFGEKKAKERRKEKAEELEVAKKLREFCPKYEYVQFLEVMYDHWKSRYGPGKLPPKQQEIWGKLCWQHPKLRDLEYKTIVDALLVCYVHHEQLVQCTEDFPISGVFNDTYYKKAEAREFPRAADWNRRLGPAGTKWMNTDQRLRCATCAKVAKEWRRMNYDPETKLRPRLK